VTMASLDERIREEVLRVVSDAPEPRPFPSDEIERRTGDVPASPRHRHSRAPEATTVDSASPETCQSCGADLTVFDLRGPDESPEPRPRKRRAAVLAVAAAILVVAGVVVVADQTDDNLVTEPVTASTTPDAVPSPTAPDSTPPPAQVGPPPSVVDSLGYRWSRVPHDEAVFGGVGRQGILDVTVGGPGLVAVGFDGGPNDLATGTGPEDAAVWTSVDGVTWSRVPHDEAVFGRDGDGKRWMYTVIAGGPGLVAIGRIDVADRDDGATAVWTSADGITWTLHEDAFNGSGPSDVAVGGPGLVGVGENEQGAVVVWTSADGVTWSRVPHDEAVFGGDGPQSMTAVTVGGPGLVAVGRSDNRYESASHSYRAGNPYEEWDADIYGQPREGDAVVWTSVDGLTWSRVPHDEAVFGGAGDQSMFDVVVGGPGLVAVGVNAQGAAIWTSTDGLTWTQVRDDDDVFGGPNEAGEGPGSYLVGARIYQVVVGDLGLLAFGENEQGNMVWTSVDGITWTRDESFFDGVRHVDPNNESRLIAAGPGLILVGSDRRDAVVWVATPEN
jgi:hypothetical protein